MKAVSLSWHAALVVALQTISIIAHSIPLVRHQALHVMVGCIELGIIVQLQDCIHYCIMNPLDVYYFEGIFLQE